MFTGISALADAQGFHEPVDPADIPPPTPIAFPCYQPFAQDDATVEASGYLSALLSSTGRRSKRLACTALSAIGLDLTLDVDVQQLIPDPSCIPDFSAWDRMTLEESQNADASTRRPLSCDKHSPGCRIYHERKTELSSLNEDAFRTVRRIQPPMGKPAPRLGSAYEFFRYLQQMTVYWDDPTRATSLPSSPEVISLDAAAGSSETPSETASSAASVAPERTRAGHQTPPETRHALVAAFVKMVAYEFGCTATPSRKEPRLQLRTPRGSPASPRKSYYPSRCQFVFQNPQTREASRAGFVYGPVAAISCRPETSFTMPDPETAQSWDLARELISVLITAQHRARQGKQEEQFGLGAWWTFKPRWGGAPGGGPIGCELQRDGISGDKDMMPDPISGQDTPALVPPTKKLRRRLYDNYRMVRPPARTWDAKAKYISIGKQAGANYDDIFLVSSLFHHISILRVRVPLRLLAVLDGAPEPDPTRRDWGTVQAWRTPWYDCFDTKDRIKAMQLVWSVMAYQMRDDTGAV
ncbi:hypothetical protein ISF_00554 [Cordyceps fumosorosea ARSEF 2679]|uniref:Uncharacterized protein n=1 Tax=Cordyceps fumosorosea (strain ARSEF 2679) TaxID=1081104 RepID=A0A168ECP6_CORFA|nr:hypothetical protein ISF_00554 [Cordyceps fumosorosea ARSEF 2679]OAA73653.1 hypothetical protein ISF_00554 [Cordyceps fumosorosea ARSEF 2679]